MKTQNIILIIKYKVYKIYLKLTHKTIKEEIARTRIKYNYNLTMNYIKNEYKINIL